MRKYLFLDANHLCHRNAWTHADLTYQSRPTGMVYGFFKSLQKCKADNPLSTVVICWDGGHERRDRESALGVEQGIIPEAYKANRGQNQSEDAKMVRWQMEQQWEPLREGLSYTSCFQALQKGYEADDLVAAYVLGCSDPSVIITSDKDYYQLLEEGVEMYDPMGEKRMSLEVLQKEYGLVSPQQWVDVKSLMGDAGDNIFGVPGVGEKTALKFIVQYKTIDNLLQKLKDQQVAGVKLGKKELSVIEYEKRIKLAYSLVIMDSTIPGLPSITYTPGNAEKLGTFFDCFGFESLKEHIKHLV